MKEEGLRYNEGKIRYDLLEPYAIEQLAKVFTFGSEKYADHNWKKGMKWSNIFSSLKRHLAAIEKGEDFDKESTLLHASHLAWNAMALLSYYKIYPQGDDRQHSYLTNLKIGLDIDDVIADYNTHYAKTFNKSAAIHWNFLNYGDSLYQNLSKKEIETFLLSIPPKIKAEDLPFEPHCYITSRNTDIRITEQWIQNNGFPTVPIYQVPHNTSKIEVAKASGIDIFVDDKFENFVELNKAGICTYLFDAPHNSKYNVGYKRIKELKELL